MEKIKEFYREHPEKFYLILLGILSVVFLFLGMGSYPLVDVDETRYAVMSRDLLGHNWNFLMLNGVPFIEKPPLYFWFTALSIKLFGFHEFAIRLPMALLALGTVFFTYYTGRKIKSPKLGFYAALILLANVYFVMLTRVAIIDMVFTAFLTWTVYCGLLTDFVEEKNKKYLWWCFYTFASFAFLAKGLLAIVFPVAIIGIHRLINKNVKEIFRPVNILPGILVFLLINLPWHIAMYKQYGFEFIWVYFILHHFERLVNADALGKTRPFLYFVPVFFVGFLPWSFHFIGTIIDFFKKKLYENKMILFFAIYFVVIFGLFSVASGKLPTYVLPAVPPAAFMVAYWVYDRDKKWLTIPVSFAIVATFVAIILLKTVVYTGGMSELVEYSTDAQHSKYHLVTYNMPVKPSIFLNYKKDYADLILDDNLNDLKKAVSEYPEIMLIYKNKNMKNKDDIDYINRYFVIVKQGKKYTLLKSNRK